MQFNIAVLFLFLRKTVSSYTISIRCGFTNRIGLTITITLFTFTSQRVKIPLYYNKERIYFYVSDITPAKIGFIGLGLIGGSVAKAIRTYFPDYELIAFDKIKKLSLSQSRKTSSTLPVLRSMTILKAAAIFSYAPPFHTTPPALPS